MEEINDEIEREVRQESDAKRAEYNEILRAYQLTFNSPAGQAVLLDLMGFGKFRTPITDPVDEGKRQVVLRVMAFATLTMDQMMALYGGNISPK